MAGAAAVLMMMACRAIPFGVATMTALRACAILQAAILLTDGLVMSLTIETTRHKSTEPYQEGQQEKTAEKSLHEYALQMQREIQFSKCRTLIFLTIPV
jgi:hypothetical protein